MKEKKEKEKIKLGKINNEGNFQYEGWKYNNEFNLTPENYTITYSKNDPKPQSITVRIRGREN